MTDDDWSLCEWAMTQIKVGRWSRPWIVTFEYGGVGALWEAVTEARTLQDQVPRLDGLRLGVSFKKQSPFAAASVRSLVLSVE